MKKVLLGLLALAMVLSLCSCSQDVYSKLGDLMGGMKENVYGIQPNMAAVAETTKAMNNSISSDGSINLGSGDSSLGSSLISSVADIKNSPQKVEALKAELSAPISVPEGHTAAEIQTNLQNEVQIIYDMVDALDTTGLSQEQADLIQSVAAALVDVQASIPAEPTMADLATVAILSEIANQAKKIADDPSALYDANGITEEGLAVADSALGSLDALKVVTEVANVDVLGDLDLMSLLSSLDSRDAGDDSDLAAFKASFDKIKAIVCVNGTVNDGKYNSFIAQSKAIKANYELISSLYVPRDGSIDNLGDILDKNIDHDLTIDDLVLYALCSAAVELDTISRDETKDFIKSLDFAEYETVLITRYSCTAEEIGERMLDDIEGKTSDFAKEVYTIASTAMVLINDCGYQSLFDYLPDDVKDTFGL